LFFFLRRKIFYSDIIVHLNNFTFTSPRSFLSHLSIAHVLILQSLLLSPYIVYSFFPYCCLLSSFPHARNCLIIAVFLTGFLFSFQPSNPNHFFFLTMLPLFPSFYHFLFIPCTFHPLFSVHFLICDPLLAYYVPPPPPNPAFSGLALKHKPPPPPQLTCLPPPPSQASKKFLSDTVPTLVRGGGYRWVTLGRGGWIDKISFLLEIRQHKISLHVKSTYSR
jgi:hypothetical protein